MSDVCKKQKKEYLPKCREINAIQEWRPVISVTVLSEESSNNGRFKCLLSDRYRDYLNLSLQNTIVT